MIIEQINRNNICNKRQTQRETTNRLTDFKMIQYKVNKINIEVLILIINSN